MKAVLKTELKTNYLNNKCVSIPNEVDVCGLGALVLYSFSPPPPMQPITMAVTHGGRGMMTIDRISGNAFHGFEDGKAHLDIGSSKYFIERMTEDRYGNNILKDVKGLGGYK